MTEKVNRRGFLKRGLLIGAAVGVTACGGTVLAATYKPVADKPSFTFGEINMTPKILVTYATKAGATAGVAEKIGETLAKKNAQVDVLPVKAVKDISAYDVVVAGSGIYVGKPLADLTSFIEKNQAALQQKAFSAFVVCLTLEKDTPEKRQEVMPYLEPVRVLVKPVQEGFFAGAMDTKKISFIERMMMKAMKSPEGDFRDWQKITAWAESLPLA